MATNNSYSKANARRLGFRSGFEVEVDKELTAMGVFHEYESPMCTFRYHKPVVNGGVIDESGSIIELDKQHRVIQWCEYTCDFMLIKGDGSPLYIETKGRFCSKDRTKHRLLKKQYPDVDIRLLFSDNGKVSDRTRYLDWARKSDIPAALIIKPNKKREGVYIPREWLIECDITYQS